MIIHPKSSFTPPLSWISFLKDQRIHGKQERRRRISKFKKKICSSSCIIILTSEQFHFGSFFVFPFLLREECLRNERTSIRSFIFSQIPKIFTVNHPTLDSEGGKGGQVAPGKNQILT